MLHWHHIIPLHAGGMDTPSNLKQITLEEHAEAHRLLWETNGAWQDWCAWKGLSTAIGQEEIRRLVVMLANIGNKNHLGKRHNEATRLKMRMAHKRSWLGRRHSSLSIEKCRETKLRELNPMFGKRHSPETKERMRLSQQKRRQQESLL